MESRIYFKLLIESIMKTKFIYSLMMVTLLFSCEEFVDIDLPTTQISSVQVFDDVTTANAAMKENYILLRDRVLLTGKGNGVSALMGFYTDELVNWRASNSDFQSFYNNSVLVTNSTVNQLWNDSYKVIYNCNKVIEGVANSTNINAVQKEQLTAEALFVRSVVYFYLIELFGDIPYVISTDYRLNTKIGKMQRHTLLQNIIYDATMAFELLENKTAANNTVANKFVLAAFLSRLHLHNKEYSKTISYSNWVINEGHFQLENDLSKVFLKESKGTIWQFKPQAEGDNTFEGAFYNFSTLPPPNNALNISLVDAFENGDLRKELWVKDLTDANNQKFYHSFKYKEFQNTTSSKEYSIIIRLEEIYYNRIEAYLNLQQTDLALVDWNILRLRNGLTSFELLPLDWKMALLQDRRSEFFCENGQRFLDLKRLDKLAYEMLLTKPSWQNYYQFLPLPQAEILLNTNLLPQNDGY